MKSTGLVLKSRNYTGSVEPPATVLEDESRWGNDGAVGDGHPDWVRLPSGLWVMSFDGVNDRVDFGNPSSLQSTGDHTILCWIKPILTGVGMITLNKDGVMGDRGWFLRILTTAKVRHYISIDGTASAYFTTTAVLSNNTWVFLSATYDGISLETYFNGVNQAGTLTGAVPTTKYNSSVNFLLGEGSNGLLDFEGLIALPHFYSRALSVTEIGKHFTAERAWFGV